MYKNIKRYQKYKNIKVDNNYLCARTCDSDCSFTHVTELQHSASPHRWFLPTSQDLPDHLGPA